MGASRREGLCETALLLQKLDRYARNAEQAISYTLLGGSVHYALADLTGFAPELIVLREGHAGFIEVKRLQACIL
jgi:hypothetical protein